MLTNNSTTLLFSISVQILNPGHKYHSIVSTLLNDAVQINKVAK
jgi:hypothetical protein